MDYIPYGKQNISEDDIRAVIEVLQSDFITQGPVVPLFENTIAEYCDVNHVFSCNSATSGLHLACLAVGIKKGDRVWTSPITFVASANCALYCGAHIDFVDIDPRTYNISVEKLEDKLKYSEMNGCLPKAVIPVHLCGQSSQMEQIREFSRKYHFKIIEDASHAIGGKYKNKPIGCCEYSDVSVFSFHPVKIVTTGEGGTVLTNSEEVAHRVELLRNHGITRSRDLMQKGMDGPWYYEMQELGFNYRMTDIQAALGASQMKRLDRFVAIRHQHAKLYGELLQGLPVITPWCQEDCFSSYHLYVIRLEGIEKRKHRTLFEYMRSKNIGVNLHYIPVHLQPYYKQMGFYKGQFPESEKYYSEAMSLPLYPDLDKKEIERVVNTLKDGLALLSGK